MLRSIAVEDGKRLATLGPAGEPVLSLETEHESARERRYLSFRLAQNTFKRELSRARSSRFLHSLEETEELDSACGRLRSAGVVISDHPAWAEGRPRYSDEFARHKMLDAIGDLALAGAYIIGHFQGVDSDHSLNTKLIRSLFEQSDAWEWIELPIGGAPDREYEGKERTFAA
jgi:UDP-3-O-[3-hydroxymyristoyl] N-acetylglucosamine deacetylase